LSVDVPIGDGQYVHLDAYKNAKNDDILRDNKSYGALKWVSFGQPRLLWSWNDKDSVFRTDEYFAFELEMLTDFDRQNLKEEVKRVKGVDVSKCAFINLIPSDLTCEINVNDTLTKESFILSGKFLLLNSGHLSILEYSLLVEC